MAEEKFDKMSVLAGELERIENSFGDAQGEDLTRTRGALLGAIEKYTGSRFALGHMLLQYKQYFRAERGWVVAARAIGAAIGRNERTVYRIIGDYEIASQLPPVTINALQEMNIDPAAAKNLKVVKKLLEMPKPKSAKDAEDAVNVAIQENLARKKLSAKTPVGSELEDFAQKIVKQFESRYGSSAPHERDAEVRYVLELVVNTLRADIRDLKIYGRPTLVPKPSRREVA